MKKLAIVFLFALLASCCPQLQISECVVVDNRETMHSADSIASWCRKKHHFNSWIIVANRDSVFLIAPDTVNNSMK